MIDSAAIWLIPWDVLSTNDRTALRWAAAGVFAALPSAIAAIAWVQAWRGSPSFSPPRCQQCDSLLLGRGSRTDAHSLPKRCPECGTLAMHDGQSLAPFATRRWRLWPATRMLLAGCGFVLLAIGAAWAGGAVVARLETASVATAQVDAIEAALTRARLPRAIHDALRFASDAAKEDPAVVEAALAVLDAFEADQISPDAGISLLLDRHDDVDARKGMLDLVKELVTLGAINEERQGQLVARIQGTLLPASDPRAIPFIARELRPRITVSDVGRARVVHVQLRARLRPDVKVLGAWSIDLGDRSEPLDATLSVVQNDVELNLATTVLVERGPASLPDVMTIRFVPDPNPVPDAAEPPLWPASLPHWPRPFQIDGIRWRS